MPNITIQWYAGRTDQQRREITAAIVREKNSFELGVAALVPMGSAFSFVGEAQIETERFEGTDSLAQILAGANWKAFGRGMLRGAVGIGLTDTTPDFRILAGYAYTY